MESRNSSGITALLGKGVEFEGRLVFEGVVRIDGFFKGQIYTRDTLIIGKDSRVQAKIDADIVIVSGLVEGDVRATTRIEIQPSGYIKGSVATPVLKIEEGGMFDGNTQMLPVSTV